jgi:thiamine transport system permease protein
MTGRAGRAALAIPPLLFVAVFFVWPVVAILGRGLLPDGQLDLSPLGDVVGDPGLREIVWFTVMQATVSTLITLAVGLPLAAVLGRYRFPGRGIAHALVTIPFVLPTIVVAAAFTSLGIRRSLLAILLAHCFFNLAVVVRVVGAAWERVDPRPADAARTLGADARRTFLHVTLPALRPATVAAASIVFLFCFTSFGVVLVLGGPQHGTLETEIYRQTATLLDLRTAAALSIVQLVVVVAALVVAGRLGGRAATTTRGPVRARPLPHGGPRWLGLAAVLPALLLVLTPVVELLRRALAHDASGLRRLTTVPNGFADTPLRMIGTSLTIAAAATFISVTLGLLLATALTRKRRPGRLARATELVVVLPLGVSAVTVGFGFLIVFDTPPLALRTSWWIVPLAQALVALPFVVRSAVPILRSVDPRQREAAALLGASPARVWREIEFPVARRAVAVAAAFAFAISLGEFGATLFIVRPETTTVPVAIYRLLGRPGAVNVDLAMTLAALLMVLTGVAAYASTRTGRGLGA